MGLGLGIKSWIQFGRESVWAQAVAATHRIGFSNCTIEAKPGIVHSPNMPAGNTTIAQGQPWMTDPANAGIDIASEYAAGNMTLPMDYNGLLQFFDMIYGTAAFGTYGAAVTGTGPYTHTFGPERELMNSATLQIYEGGVRASTVARVVGAKLLGLTLSGAAGGALSLSLDVIGQQKALNLAPTAALSCIPRVPIYFSHLTSADDGSSDGDLVLKAFELSIKPSMAAPEFRDGTKYIREPVRDGLITTTLKLTREYTSDTLITAFQAGTLLTSKPSLTFSTGTYGLVITFNKAKIVAAPQPTPSLKGIMLQEVTYEAQWDTTLGGCTIAITGAQNGAAA